MFVNTSNMTPGNGLTCSSTPLPNCARRQEARLLIIGKGSGRSSAAEQIRRLGLSADAETAGWVDDPLQFAARAYAFVLSSDEEGFAQVLTEAMSTGCPVITTDALGGGPRFVTDDGKYGLLVPRGNRAELAGAMERMLQPDVRARYSSWAERAEALSPAASADALVDFLAGHVGVVA